jgi:hypothetical protein
MERFNKVKTSCANGLLDKLPSVDLCCLFIPLRIGAFIIAFCMLAWNIYSGTTLFLFGWDGIHLSIVLKVLGAIYVLIGLVGIYGFKAIYEENQVHVHVFTIIYSVCVFLWILFQIVIVIVEVVIVNRAVADACAVVHLPAGDCPGYTFDIGAWIAPFLVGFTFQVYYIVCLVSYDRHLAARLNTPQNFAADNKI